MIADKIKLLREAKDLTQADLARKLGVTRSGVNAWEMGITVLSTQFVTALAELFEVSADYLLGIEKTATVSVEGLTERQVAAITEIIECMKK